MRSSSNSSMSDTLSTPRSGIRKSSRVNASGSPDSEDSSPASTASSVTQATRSGKRARAAPLAPPRVAVSRTSTPRKRTRSCVLQIVDTCKISKQEPTASRAMRGSTVRARVTNSRVSAATSRVIELLSAESSPVSVSSDSDRILNCVDVPKSDRVLRRRN